MKKATHEATAEETGVFWAHAWKSCSRARSSSNSSAPVTAAARPVTEDEAREGGEDIACRCVVEVDSVDGHAELYVA